MTPLGGLLLTRSQAVELAHHQELVFEERQRVTLAGRLRKAICQEPEKLAGSKAARQRPWAFHTPSPCPD